MKYLVGFVLLKSYQQTHCSHPKEVPPKKYIYPFKCMLWFFGGWGVNIAIRQPFPLALNMDIEGSWWIAYLIECMPHMNYKRWNIEFKSPLALPCHVLYRWYDAPWGSLSWRANIFAVHLRSSRTQNIVQSALSLKEREEYHFLIVIDTKIIWWAQKTQHIVESCFQLFGSWRLTSEQRGALSHIPDVLWITNCVRQRKKWYERKWYIISQISQD